MIKSLKDARITDALPRIVAGQDWVIALSNALGVQHEQTIQFADDSQIYTNLDNVSEDILDTLAINWKIDWYDTDYSIEQKRRIIKMAILVRRLMGTPYATRIQADAIYPGRSWRNGLIMAERLEHSACTLIYQILPRARQCMTMTLTSWSGG